MKDISDIQVLRAVQKSWDLREKGSTVWAYTLLVIETGQAEKVCFRCMERVYNRDYIDYGVSLRTAWLTDKGVKLMTQPVFITQEPGMDEPT